MKLRNAVPLLWLAVACGRGEDAMLSSPSYRLAAPSSAGLTWKVHQPVIRLCYTDSSNSATHRADVIYAVEEWIRGIAEIAQEPLATSVELVARTAPCDANVRIGNYSPANTQMGSKPTVNINFSGWFGSKSVTLHEFGHAFGLLDTYNGSGGSCQSGHPNSVMCRASYLTLQPDDINGIRDMYRRVKQARGVRITDEHEGQIVQ